MVFGEPGLTLVRTGADPGQEGGLTLELLWKMLLVGQEVQTGSSPWGGAEGEEVLAPEAWNNGQP